VANWSGAASSVNDDILFGSIIVITIMAIAWAGVNETLRHRMNLEEVDVRIHVNGTRGKSMTTRLIQAGLSGSGIKTMAKTTGKAPRIIDTDGFETTIERGHSPNIREQMDFIKMAAKKNLDAVVIECMAIQPELQRISEEHMIRSTIGVITNIRPDHLDAMGPTIDDAAESLSSTIPERGILVTAEKTFLSLLKEKAREKGTEVISVEPGSVTKEEMKAFPYLVFPENIAIAIEVCRILGIERDEALAGMLKAKPDVSAIEMIRCKVSGKSFMFINAMGVNDPASTLVVYDTLKEMYFPSAAPLGYFSSRGDRVYRSTSFGESMAKEMDFSQIVVAGGLSNLFALELSRSGYPKGKVDDLGSARPDEIVKVLEKRVEDNGVIFACGNMVGRAPTYVVEHFRKEGSSSYL